MSQTPDKKYPIQRTIKDWIYMHSFNDLDQQLGEKLLIEYIEHLLPKPLEGERDEKEHT